MKMSLPLAGLALCAALPALAAVEDRVIVPDNRYDDCINAIAENPDLAFENAMIWRDQGGGAPAEHCVANALLALGYAGEAAVRFDALAREAASGPPEERAELLMQSGEAWLLVRRGDLAEAAFSAALTQAPRNPQVWAARARARAMEEEWAEAETDLDAAITFDNAQAEFYVLRSAARKAQGKTAAARTDIDTALRLNPDSPDALAERGLMYSAAGDKDSARHDFIRVLNLAPDSAAADVARLGIERMEIRIEP